MPKETSKTRVAAALEELRGLDVAGLTRWAKAHGINSCAGFAAYKKALLSFDIDYEDVLAAAPNVRKRLRRLMPTG